MAEATPSEFSQEESFPVFPVFLLIDVSYSMEGEPMQAVNDSLPELKSAIADDPTVGEMARISVITFSEEARTVLPLCDLEYAEIPRLVPEGGTNFAEAFRVAKREIEAGVRSLGKGTRFYRPVVFLLSDGFHTAQEDWKGPIKDLCNDQFKFHPEIVTFGFGEAHADDLSRIATRFAFLATAAKPAECVREILRAITGSIKTSSGSLRQAGGGLVIEADASKFTQLPEMTVEDW